MAEMRFRRRNCEIAFQANGQTSLRRRERAPPFPKPGEGKGSALLWLSLSNRSRGARSAFFTSKCLRGPNCQGYCHPSLAGGSYPTMRSFGEGVKLTRQCKKCIMQHRTR